MEKASLLALVQSAKPGDILKLKFVSDPFPKKGLKTLWALIQSEIVKVPDGWLGKGTLTVLKINTYISYGTWLVDADREVRVIVTDRLLDNAEKFSVDLSKYLILCNLVRRGNGR